MLQHIELMVVPAEFKAHRRQWYSSLVKEIHAWPQHVDMMPKKRKWLALNAGDDFVMIDDDLSLFTWSHTLQRYVAAKAAESQFNRRMLETLPSFYAAGHSMVSVPMKFMADMYIKKTESLKKENDVGFVFTGFKRGAADHVKFNRVVSFTDMSVPIQVLERHKRSMTYYGLCFSQSNAAIYKTTGMNSYRTDFIKKDSALKMLQLHRGIVTDFKFDSGNGGGVSLKKFTRRILTGATAAHKEVSDASLSKWLTELGLNSAPRQFTYEDDMPLADVVAELTRRWRSAER